jgi:hypothetical protein
MLRSMPMKFQNINPMTTLSTLKNILTMIKTLTLDLDTITYNEFKIIPSVGFLIYSIFAKLEAESSINHLAKLFRRNQLA